MKAEEMCRLVLPGPGSHWGPRAGPPAPRLGRGGGGRDALEGGGGNPPPFQSAQPAPSYVSLTPSASCNGICNRQ